MYTRTQDVAINLSYKICKGRPTNYTIGLKRLIIDTWQKHCEEYWVTGVRFGEDNNSSIYRKKLVNSKLKGHNLYNSKLKTNS
jgi:hypothetical protein